MYCYHRQQANAGVLLLLPALTHLDAHGLHVGLVLHLTDAPRSSQQRLGGHAAAVDAGATDVVALDHSHLHAL